MFTCPRKRKPVVILKTVRDKAKWTDFFNPVGFSRVTYLRIKYLAGIKLENDFLEFLSTTKCNALKKYLAALFNMI